MISNNIAFKGYDARPLGAIITRYNGSVTTEPAKELQEIGKKHGFDVIFQTGDRIYRNPANLSGNYTSHPNVWTQDHVTYTPKKDIITSSPNEDANRELSIYADAPVRNDFPHVAGGNYFIAKQDGKDVLIVGKNDINSFKYKAKDVFNIDKVIQVSQPDFHIDLGIRPLNNKNILVSDDEMTISHMEKALQNADKYLETHDDEDVSNAKKLIGNALEFFKQNVGKNEFRDPEIVGYELEDAGFNIIKVPSRIYTSTEKEGRPDLAHKMNYMNAIVHENVDGSLVYITNKSQMNQRCGITPQVAEKIDFDFEKMFTDAVAPYIKKENIYFISGKENSIAKCLESNRGGIHCLCAEIPKTVLPSRHAKA